MNNKLNRELKQYCRRIERALLCDRHEKKTIISSIRSGISDFIESNPDADFGTIEEHFGSAKDIAEEYYNNTDANEIKSKINTRKSIVIGIIIALAVALIIYAVAIAAMVIADVKSGSGYSIEYIGDVSGTDIRDVIVYHYG